MSIYVCWRACVCVCVTIRGSHTCPSPPRGWLASAQGSGMDLHTHNPRSTSPAYNKNNNTHRQHESDTQFLCVCLCGRHTLTQWQWWRISLCWLPADTEGFLLLSSSVERLAPPWCYCCSHKRKTHIRLKKTHRWSRWRVQAHRLYIKTSAEIKMNKIFCCKKAI